MQMMTKHLADVKKSIYLCFVLYLKVAIFPITFSHLVVQLNADHILSESNVLPPFFQVPWYVPCGGVCYGDGNLVFVANDWHTAILPVYLKAYYRDNGIMKFTRSILVIHNIAHQVC